MDKLHCNFTNTALSAEVFFLHGGERGRSTAFEKKTGGQIELCLPRTLGTTGAVIELYFEGGTKVYRRLPCSWCGMHLDYDLYRASLSDVRVGLYFFRVLLFGAFGELFGYRTHGRLYFSADPATAPTLQLSVCEFSYPAPKQKYGGIIYHVFVDRFAKGSKTYPLSDGAILNPDWDTGIPQFAEYPGAPLKNNMFFGGTLTGIEEKLSYLAELGVSTIYLSPIFESPSNHKYDTADYMRVDKMFGGEEALVSLISKAKEYGIGILLDGVFNHTGADSIYFNRYGRYSSLGAYQSKNSPYYEWYDFQSFPTEYTSWWGIEILPRIHPDIKTCGDYFVGKGGVLRKYMQLGIEGFRLDVADELSDAFLSKIKSALNDENKHSVLYGEVWEDASNKIAYGVRKKYYLGKELDGVMNYPVREGLVAFFKYGDCERLRYALTDVTENAPKRILDLQMNLIGTHDTERILTVLGGAPRGDRTNAELSLAKLTPTEHALGKERLMMAYTVLATLPGIPSIYYGDEVGVQGYQDPFNRLPFPWGREDGELLMHYQLLGKLRRAHSVYKEGVFALLLLTDTDLVFARFHKSYAYLTVVNRSQNTKKYVFDAKAENLFTSSRAIAHRIPPMTARVFRAPRNTTFYIQ